ncbi:MAG: hypothetical protein WBK77_01340 [Alphaproteobacteria bacterium]
MDDKDKKFLAQGMAALCVRDTWNNEICEPFSKHEEMRQFMRDVVNRLYSVLLRADDPDFMRKLTLYGSLTDNLYGEPEELKGLLEGEFVAQVDRMALSEQEEGNQ